MERARIQHVWSGTTGPSSGMQMPPLACWPAQNGPAKALPGSFLGLAERLQYSWWSGGHEHGVEQRRLDPGVEA